MQWMLISIFESRNAVFINDYYTMPKETYPAETNHRENMIPDHRQQVLCNI